MLKIIVPSLIFPPVLNASILIKASVVSLTKSVEYSLHRSASHRQTINLSDLAVTPSRRVVRSRSGGIDFAFNCSSFNLCKVR